MPAALPKSAASSWDWKTTGAWAARPKACCKIVEAVKSPWLQVTLDTGNFLEDPYEKLEQLAPRTTFVQAKTYYGGGMWYTLDLDYPRIAAMLRNTSIAATSRSSSKARNRLTPALPKSLAVLRAAFTRPTC